MQQRNSAPSGLRRGAAAEDLDKALAIRDVRQAEIVAFGREAFTPEQMSSLPQRGIRLLEEAIEAAQAAGVDSGMAHKLVDYVFARPPGVLSQELGGVGVCVLALAEAAGVSADAEEEREVNRLLSKGVAFFRARNEAKNAAGFLLATTYPTGRQGSVGDAASSEPMGERHDA